MAKLTRQDLLPYEQYKNLHEKFLKEVITEKKIRRVAISDRMTGLFESRLTVFYQIHEMIRAEQITNEDYLNEMLEVYNELLPGETELAMTLFIEIPDQDTLRGFNKTIVGIENHVELSFASHSIKSYEPSDEKEADEEYTQSVHYLHFPFEPESKKDFINNNQAVTIRVNHPNYQAEVKLSDHLLRELQEQLKQT